MIKLLIPDMPTADDLLPYLRRIDAAKVYVNRGPLVQELEARLEQMTGVPCVTVSNGTVALELALKALIIDESYDDDGIMRHSYIAVPALTFAASGLSILRNRLTPLICDVDEMHWQTSPRTVEDACAEADIKRYTRMLECVMPVATFGDPVYVRQWEGYSVPIVIDAAGAFPAQEVSKDPNIATCFSLHATKFIGCGEGGFVASANKELIERVRGLSMFGEGGTNAKMSEYHAAVALASLDRGLGKMQRSVQVAKWYVNRFQDMPMIKQWAGFNMYATLGVVELLSPVTSGLINKLKDEGIETKQWYRPYLDERDDFGHHPCGTFPVTDHLRDHLLGLPFHNFLTEADVAHVCSTLKRILQ